MGTVKKLNRGGTLRVIRPGRDFQRGAGLCFGSIASKAYKFAYGRSRERSVGRAPDQQNGAHIRPLYCRSGFVYLVFDLHQRNAPLVLELVSCDNPTCFGLSPGYVRHFFRPSEGFPAGEKSHIAVDIFYQCGVAGPIFPLDRSIDRDLVDVIAPILHVPRPAQEQGKQIAVATGFQRIHQRTFDRPFGSLAQDLNGLHIGEMVRQRRIGRGKHRRRNKRFPGRFLAFILCNAHQRSKHENCTHASYNHE